MAGGDDEVTRPETTFHSEESVSVDAARKFISEIDDLIPETPPEIAAEVMRAHQKMRLLSPQAHYKALTQEGQKGTDTIRVLSSIDESAGVKKDDKSVQNLFVLQGEAATMFVTGLEAAEKRIAARETAQAAVQAKTIEIEAETIDESEPTRTES